MGHQPKLKDMKIEHEEDDGCCPWKRRPKTRGHITTDQHIYQIFILVSKVTKMPPWVEYASPMTWTGSLTW